MTVTHLIAFTAGLLLLYYGAGWLVRGASTLARGMGLTPMVIGLTVVAFGTSAPELVVSLVSAAKGKSMIALGNVVGSNICNIALVLGLTAVFQPVTTSRIVITRDIPLMLAISAFLLLLSFNSVIGRLEGVILFCGIIAYTWFNYKVAVRVDRTMPDAAGAAPPAVGLMERRWAQCLMIAGGTVAVVVGADLLVDAAVSVMSALGVNEKFVGLTVVAFGHLGAGTGHLRRGGLEKGDGHLLGEPGGQQRVQPPQCRWRHGHGKTHCHLRRFHRQRAGGGLPGDDRHQCTALGADETGLDNYPQKRSDSAWMLRGLCVFPHYKVLNRDSERIPRRLLARSKNPANRGRSEAEMPLIGAAGRVQSKEFDDIHSHP